MNDLMLRRREMAQAGESGPRIETLYDGVFDTGTAFTNRTSSAFTSGQVTTLTTKTKEIIVILAAENASGKANSQSIQLKYWNSSGGAIISNIGGSLSAALNGLAETCVEAHLVKNDVTGQWDATITTNNGKIWTGSVSLSFQTGRAFRFTTSTTSGFISARMAVYAVLE